jgi:hypothetical protein
MCYGRANREKLFSGMPVYTRTDSTLEGINYPADYPHENHEESG